MSSSKNCLKKTSFDLPKISICLYSTQPQTQAIILNTITLLIYVLFYVVGVYPLWMKIVFLSSCFIHTNLIISKLKTAPLKCYKKQSAKSSCV